MDATPTLDRPHPSPLIDLKEQLQRTLGTNYILERELGGGGMSRVFVAEEVSLDRKVVVKVLPPDLAASVNVERFRREIQLAAKLQHPHIVPVLSAGISEGLPYYTMPFIEGESLRARIARSGELPLNEAARILRDVLSALSYAHAHGVVHRDIKPDNVLLTGNHAVVADFGVAKALSASTNSGSSLTSLGVALGTPAYMSPEQAAADPNTDHRSDLYAVGAMAYEMLTGHQVFSARSPQAMLAAHAIEKPEPIDKRRPMVPSALSSLVMRALEKHAADRPQTAAEMLGQLEAAVTPSGATPPSGFTPVQRRRRWAKLITVGGGIAALALLGFFGFRAYGGQSDLDTNRVMVAPFQNRTGDRQFDQLGTMASDWLIRGINETGISDIAEFAPVHVTSGRITPSELERASLRRQARILGAGRFVSGDFHLVGDSLQFQARITDTGDGTLIGSVTLSSSPKKDPMSGINTMRPRVLGALAFASGSEVAGLSTMDAPPSFPAYKEFLRGDEAFRRGDWLVSLTHLRRAAALDTNYLAPLVREAYLYANLRQCAGTDSIGELLNDKRDRMSPFEGHYLDRVLAWCKGDYNAAYTAAKRMATIAPKSSFAKYISARSAIEINRPREAIKGLEALNWRKPHVSAYYADLTRALHSVGDYRHELEVATAFRENFPGSIGALNVTVRALAALGRVEEARQRVSESMTLPGQGLTAAEVMMTASSELIAHGRAAEGRQIAELLVTWLRERPAAEQDDATLAAALLMAGNKAEARSIAKKLLAKDPRLPAALALEGVAAAETGDRAAAERAIVELESLKPKYRRGINLLDRARIAAALGEKARAVEYLREGIRQGLTYIAQLHDAVPELLSLRGYAPYDELVRPKG